MKKVFFISSWDRVAPLMQTEIARLSIFMSLAGYTVLFSDLIFKDGYPNFTNLGIQDLSSGGPSLFCLPSTMKWQMFYFAMVFLMAGRLLYVWGCPDRLKEHGFQKFAFVQSVKTALPKTAYDEMFKRVCAAHNSRGIGNSYEFEQKKRELDKLLYPDYDRWATVMYNHNLKVSQNAWGNGASASEAAPLQKTALMIFLEEVVVQDFKLAILEARFCCMLSGIAGVIGYFLIVLPSIDLLKAVIHAVVLQ